MVGYISKYLSYTQSCVGCIGRLVYSSKKLASGVARSIQKGLCVTGLMLVPGVCSAKLILRIFDLVVIKSVDRIVRITLQVRRVECVSSFLCSLQSVPFHSVVMVSWVSLH